MGFAIDILETGTLCCDELSCSQFWMHLDSGGANSLTTAKIGGGAITYLATTWAGAQQKLASTVVLKSDSTYLTMYIYLKGTQIFSI